MNLAALRSLFIATRRLSERQAKRLAIHSPDRQRRGNRPATLDEFRPPRYMEKHRRCDACAFGLRVSQARLLRRVEAAEYVRTTWGVPCQPSWLAKLAVVGGGPPFKHVGRFPMYAREDLDRWVLSRMGPLKLSTSAA